MVTHVLRNAARVAAGKVFSDRDHAEALIAPRLAPLIRAVQVFGFHLATLDLRQSSDQHELVIAELLATMYRVRTAFNPELGLEGVLLTMYDERTNLGQQVSGNIREFFGEKVFSTVIPRNIRLGEAPSHGVPVILYDARSRGAEAYISLAKEFLSREHALGHHQ